MQRKFSVFIDNGVPCISTALIAHHHIIVPREQIDHAALPLISPVDPDNGTSFHGLTSLFLVCCFFREAGSLSGCFPQAGWDTRLPDAAVT